MVELVDTHVSGTCGLGCGGSSPPLGTTDFFALVFFRILAQMVELVDMLL